MKPVLSCLVAISLAASALAQPSLRVEHAPDHSLHLSWPDSPSGFVAESSPVVGPAAAWTPEPTLPAAANGRLTLIVLPADQTRFYRLRQAVEPIQLTRITSTSPAAGETGVAVTRETIFRLDRPLADETIVTSADCYAEFGGRRLLARPEVSLDRRTITLFFLENLPADTRVRVVLDGTNVEDSADRPLDADADGQPGGRFSLTFDTAPTIGLPQTGVVGRVYASERAPDGSNQPLANVTITVDGAEETLRTTTDADGAFRLMPAPAGRFFVHVDGRTSSRSQWPGGAYYPFVGKAWESIPGKTNNLAGGTGEIFLPRISSNALQRVSPTEITRVTFESAVTATNPALAGVEVAVPPNALFNESGVRGGKVGIAAVPPDRLPEPLPPGLNLPLVITIQTDGPQNFNQPVPVRFPNLPDPRTGVTLPAGAKTVLWSFNHDTGRWEAQGTATITPDGNYATTDPGVGVRQPGWHGVAPGISVVAPPRAPLPSECSGDDCPDCVQTVFCNFPNQEGKHYALCAFDCLGNVLDDLFGDKPKTPDSPFEVGLRCIGGPDKCPRNPEDTLSKERRDCMDKCRFPNNRRRVFVVPCEGFYDPCAGSESSPALQGRVQPLSNGSSLLPDRFEEQFRFWEVEGEFLTRLTGTAKILENSDADVPKVSALFDAFADRARPESPDGIHLSPTERAELLALPRPSQFDTTAWAGVIDRLDSLQGKPMPADVVAADRALTDLVAELKRRGWKGRLDGVVHGFARLSRVRAPHPGSAEFPARSHHFLIHHHESGFDQRGRLNSAGGFDGLVLSPESHYTIYYFDDRTGYAGAAFFVSSAVGETTVVPSAPLEPFDTDAPDSDQDGLPDAAERILGTHPNQPDSDGDGIRDGLEVIEGTNPLDGTPSLLGTVAVADTVGTAFDVTALDDLAVVADGTGGVALFDVANPLAPRRLSQIATPGRALGVALEGNLLAVALEGSGVALFDVANPALPALVARTNLLRIVRAVAFVPGAVVAGLDTGELALLGRFGDVLQKTAADNLAVQDLLVLNDVVYALKPGYLEPFRFEHGSLTSTGKIPAPGKVGAGGHRLRLATDGARLYATHTQGFNVFDATSGLTPILLRSITTAQFGWKQMVPIGNGYGLAAVDGSSSDDGPNDVSLFNLGPQGTGTNLVSTLDTPGSAAALVLHRCFALVADGSAGLSVVNFFPRDPGTNSPAVNLLPRFADNASTAEAGAQLTLVANATDDHLVREVEFFLNETRLGVDGGIPFEFKLTPPSQPTFTVRARALDSAGNASWSSVISIDTSRDQTAPLLLASRPTAQERFAPGSPVQIGAEFTETMDPASLAAGLQLFAAGPDGKTNTADDLRIPATIVASGPRAAELTPIAPLPLGLYTVRATSAATDLAGNGLVRDTSWTFSVQPYADFTSATNRVWNNLPATSNSWAIGRIPTIDDFVRFGAGNGSTVTVSRSVAAYDVQAARPLDFLNDTTLQLASVARFEAPIVVRRGTWTRGRIVLANEARFLGALGVRNQQWVNRGHVLLGPNAALDFRNDLGTDTTCLNSAQATWEMFDSQMASSGAGLVDFVNEGRLVSRASGRNSIGVSRFVNAGTVVVERGSLDLASGDPTTGPSQHLGSYEVAAGATLRFLGLSEFGRASRISGEGDVLLSEAVFPGRFEGDGTNTISGVVSLTGSVRSRGSWFTQGGTLVVAGLSPEMTGPVVAEGGLTVSAQPRLVLSKLDAYADLTVNTVLDIEGPLLLDASSTPSGTTASPRLLGSGLLRARGPTTFVGIINSAGPGLLEIAGPAQAKLGTILQFDATGYALAIAPGGQFDVGALTRLTARGGVTNDGVLVKTGTNVTEITSRLVNRGSVRVQAGTLLVRNGPLLQSAGACTLAGGNLSILPTPAVLADASAQLTGGTLEGSGTLTCTSVTNRARISPGTPLGILNLQVGEHSVLSLYQQLHDGTLTLDLAGPDPGSGHDQVRISGRAILDGTLELRPAPGFDPPVGQEFIILTHAARLGTFATVTGTTLPSGRHLELVYGDTSTRLKVTGP